MGLPLLKHRALLCCQHCPKPQALGSPSGWAARFPKKPHYKVGTCLCHCRGATPDVRAPIRHTACHRCPQNQAVSHLPRELVAALGALELPHSLVPADVDTQLLHRWEEKEAAAQGGPAGSTCQQSSCRRSPCQTCQGTAGSTRYL